MALQKGLYRIYIIWNVVIVLLILFTGMRVKYYSFRLDKHRDEWTRNVFTQAALFPEKSTLEEREALVSSWSPDSKERKTYESYEYLLERTEDVIEIIDQRRVRARNFIFIYALLGVAPWVCHPIVRWIIRGFKL